MQKVPVAADLCYIAIFSPQRFEDSCFLIICVFKKIVLTWTRIELDSGVTDCADGAEANSA